MTAPLIDILLATYNGSLFLREQIESLLGQDYPAFRILASDDGSSDGTAEVLADYAQRCPERVVLVPNPRPGRGALRNFEHLMATSLAQGWAQWFAFADQDDIWLPNKLSLSAARLHALEADGDGVDLPCLVHTDLCVVDAQRRIVHPSMARYEGLNPAAATPQSLLSVNEVTGCTLVGNRRLLELALPLPDAAIVHDWWCAVIAGSGRRAYIPRATVHYRQHDANQIGARNRRLWSRVRRALIDGAGVWQRVHQLGAQTWHQAVALQRRLRERGLDDGYVAAYLRWRALPRLVRLADYRRYYTGPELDRLSRWCLWRAFDIEPLPPGGR
ncbi:glycosyltransferase family 2 protein [Tepidimonas charontis]|uniref:Putative glycosyltransferase EpsE n=1 Tax=Tepidimonas charontis TaxID=2267262 RepID=A0A554X3Z2_9BURK|nr:glycosyltransferase family 2 protein [Tepidimonas charontis]TSE30557.1 putative glycosyltransferase EpsE [Tepidimonas charontis]